MGDVADNAALVFNRSDSITFGGVISGTGALVQMGAGTLILIADNSYSGDTSVALGTLQAGSSTALSGDSAFSVISLLDLHGFNNTIGSLSGTGVVTNDGGSPATLTFGGNNTNTTFSGSLTDGSSSLGFTGLRAFADVRAKHWRTASR